MRGLVIGPDHINTLRRRDLPGWCHAVLSGHIHRHQVLPGDTPVLYCGSTERTSWAEQNETKGFCELTLHRGDPRLQTRFVPLPSRTLIDFDGRRYSGNRQLLTALQSASKSWHAHSLVRIQRDHYPDAALQALLTRELDCLTMFHVRAGSAGSAASAGPETTHAAGSGQLRPADRPARG